MEIEPFHSPTSPANEEAVSLPLKLPPCRQQVGDALGSAMRFEAQTLPSESPKVSTVGFDPFEAAVEHIRKEDEKIARSAVVRRAHSFELFRNLKKAVVCHVKGKGEVHHAGDEQAQSSAVLQCVDGSRSFDEKITKSGWMVRRQHKRNAFGSTLTACFGFK